MKNTIFQPNLTSGYKVKRDIIGSGMAKYIYFYSRNNLKMVRHGFNFFWYSSKKVKRDFFISYIFIMVHLDPNNDFNMVLSVHSGEEI